MWQAKLKIRHDCIFDDRCEKFKVEASVTSFNPFKKGGLYYAYHFGTVVGDNSKKFLKSLQKDKRVEHFESEGNTFLVIEKRKEKNTPGMAYTPELIYLRPPFVDKSGIETWEIASLKKETILKFCQKVKECKLISIRQTKLKEIYFPRLSPNLSEEQRKALFLAIKENYYGYPRKIKLEELAGISKKSRATFREHLRKAERKVLGSQV